MDGFLFLFIYFILNLFFFFK
uniref:Uncharacterized protein n=1 Tax=Anguilla anguilla TaxID=7936 RepID=A0A0E9QE18_ANGAN